MECVASGSSSEKEVRAFTFSCISSVICASSAESWPSFTVSNNSFTVNGLCKQPAKPCSCKAALSISLRAVTAITGIVFACGILEARNSFTRSNPLMAGICISVSNTSKTEERSCSISCSSCSQHTASIPCCFNMAAVRFSWILSSSIKSTRMTFMGGMAADCLRAYGLSFSEDSLSGDSLSARDLPTG